MFSLALLLPLYMRISKYRLINKNKNKNLSIEWAIDLLTGEKVAFQ